jgi:UDP-3-O-[3-hydroxymyristoyl] glucosamine N-acyltransferase LpxD
VFKLSKEVSFKLLANKLGLDFRGLSTASISNVGSLDVHNEQSVVFSKEIAASNSNAIMIGVSSNVSENLIFSENPRFDFIRALNILHETVGFDKSNTPPVIHPSVKIGRNVVVENGVIIGEGTLIEHNVVIFENTIIGDNCIIRSNTSIGSDGFGFERGSDGTPYKFIHLGGVRIGDFVEVGSNVCIARGSLGSTIIENHVKIDNLVMVAHNCLVKQGAFLIGGCTLGGGVVIGEYSWISPNASLINKVTIGDRAMVGIGAIVIKDVPNNATVASYPAKKISNN